MTENDTERIKFTLRIAPELRDKLAALAKQQHRSLNEQIIFMLEQQLSQQEPEDTGTTQPR